ncbi:MAG TPA: hypothetical protein VKC61_11240 [Pyrinomonadaceae bacterium]|nr:hypothetical protein [Pyrinomonadaceae bacterium]
MFGLQIIDIAVGLIFIYLILALTCTAVNELIAGWVDRRTKNLVQGIRNLLNDAKGKDSAPGSKPDTTLVDSFYSHPLIKALEENGRKPSYIPSRTFALTLLDLISPAGSEPKTIEDIRGAVQKLPEDSTLRRAMLVMIDDAGGDLKKVQANIEIWFNNSMDRVSAWYKTRTQTIIIIIAVLVVLATNADTLRIGKALSNDQALRDALVAQAQEYVKTPPPQGTPDASKPPADKVEEIKKNVTAIQTLGVPLGYKGEQPDGFNWWLSKLLGLILTIGAASLGAPFWFDMLNKFINVRSAGKSPDEVAKPPEAPPKRQEEVPPK